MPGDTGGYGGIPGDTRGYWGIPMDAGGIPGRYRGDTRGATPGWINVCSGGGRRATGACIYAPWDGPPVSHPDLPSINGYPLVCRRVPRYPPVSPGILQHPPVSPQHEKSQKPPQGFPQGSFWGFPQGFPPGSPPRGSPQGILPGDPPGGSPREFPRGIPPGDLPRISPEGDLPDHPRGSPQGNPPEEARVSNDFCALIATSYNTSQSIYDFVIVQDNQLKFLLPHVRGIAIGVDGRDGWGTMGGEWCDGGHDVIVTSRRPLIASLAQAKTQA